MNLNRTLECITRSTKSFVDSAYRGRELSQIQHSCSTCNTAATLGADVAVYLILGRRSVARHEFGFDHSIMGAVHRLYWCSLGE